MRASALLLLVVALAGCATGTDDRVSPPTFTLVQSGSIVDGVANLTLAAHTKGMRFEDLAFSLGGDTLRRVDDWARPAAREWSWCPPEGKTLEAGAAGGSILVGGARAGAEFVVLDPAQRLRVATLTLHS